MLAMKKLIRSKLLVIIGVAFGAVAGFLYWNYIGCESGTCSITSKPINSTIYGSFMGGLLFSMFKKEKQSK